MKAITASEAELFLSQCRHATRSNDSGIGNPEATTTTYDLASAPMSDLRRHVTARLRALLSLTQVERVTLTEQHNGDLVVTVISVPGGTSHEERGPAAQSLARALNQPVRAALTVCSAAHDADDAAELMSLLGLTATLKVA